MKRKYYDRVDGKLYEYVICDSCRTEDAGTFDCLYVVRCRNHCRTGV